MFKLKVVIAPEIMTDIFQIEDKPYILRHKIFSKKQQCQICKLWYSDGMFLWSQNLGYNTQSVSKYQFTFSFQRINGFQKTVHVEFAKIMLMTLASVI